MSIIASSLLLRPRLATAIASSSTSRQWVATKSTARPRDQEREWEWPLQRAKLPQKRRGKQRQKRRELEDAYTVARTDAHVAKSLGVPFIPWGWISRAAFKLFELDKRCRFLTPSLAKPRPKVIVDLGAAPGGWTQMAHYLLNQPRRNETSSTPSDSTIFALDRLPLSPEMETYPGVSFIQGNFLDEDIQAELSAHIARVLNTDSAAVRQPQVDVILSDMMVNTSGQSVTNNAASLALVMAVHHFCIRNLKVHKDSWMVVKIFQSEESLAWRKETLEKCFTSVGTYRAATTRKTSPEVYWVCKGYLGPQQTQQQQQQQDESNQGGF